MHRKPEVSLFSIIAILTINCVINAIQQLCKQAVSDVVSYLQYEDNKNDAFGVFLLLLFFPPSWVWFFQASSHCLNHSRPIYTVTGFTAGGKLVCRFPVSYQSQRNLISWESCLFLRKGGEFEYFPFWHLSNPLLFHTRKTGTFLLLSPLG